jgi:SNF2 family DNA or RNA helicase
LSFTLKSYQEKTIKFGVDNSYVILGLDCGLGKSLCSLAISEESKSKTLIVCPSYLKLKWKSEIDKFYPGKTVTIFNSAKEIYKVWDSDYVIISYSLLDKSDCLFEWADMVIVDEAHYLKEMRTKRTEAFHRLVYENSIKRCLLLTGTPIQNRVYEFYSLIAICNYNPQMEESSFLKKYPTYVDFANRFSFLKEFEMFRGGRRVKIQQWEGIKNELELKEWLKNIFISFKSDEVLDLPPYVDIDVPVCFEDMPELLEDFERFTGEVTGTEATAKAQAALIKAPYTVDYVKGLLEQVGQVVVYTDHVASCELIAEGLGAQAITGKTPMRVREKLAQEFMDGKSRVIVATIGSFSTGIDLYRSFNMVISDFCWVPGNMKQALFRIRRIGQKNKCFFHRIIGTPQDKIIIKKLEAKMAVIREII